jgi:peptide/nickel transport system substrate-binding protein
MEERAELFAIAIEGSMDYAVEIQLFDATSFTPRRVEVEVTADLAAAVAGADLWPWTIRRTGEVGGAMTVAMPSILSEPWNPIGGTNWVYDLSLQRAIEDSAVFNDPYTGLQLPQRLERAEVYVEEGLPVGVTLDWLTLEFVPEGEIVVPDDAWADWDAANQVFVTSAEKAALEEVETRTATAKYVCVYEDDIFETQWHDGSFFSLGDIAMLYIMFFDQAFEDSAIYDADAVSIYNSNMASFKGFKIVSTDPLTTEFYTDNYALDAEEGITDFRCGWPSYGFGISPWHMITIGVMAEAEGLLTFNQPKSDRLEVEWMSYIGGPSIDILAAELETAAADNYIPYAPTMSQYVTEEEAATRWANYQDWFARKGHFYVGNGPYYLERAFAVEGTVILKHNPNYKDLADKWSGYSAPKIADVEVDGAGRVTAGSEATFDVYVTFGGEDYPLAELDGVKFLVFDATGALAYVGDGVAVEDGLYTVTVPADVTGGLETGASRIEVIVVSKVVSIPTSSTFEFVVE